MTSFFEVLPKTCKILLLAQSFLNFTHVMLELGDVIFESPDKLVFKTTVLLFNFVLPLHALINRLSNHALKLIVLTQVGPSREQSFA